MTNTDAAGTGPQVISRFVSGYLPADRGRPVFVRCCGARAALALGHGGLVLRIAGELDLDSVPGLNTMLAHIARTPAVRPIVVDLRAVWFTDSHGLRPLLDAVDRPQVNGAATVRLRFGTVSRRAGRVLDLLGVPYVRQL